MAQKTIMFADLMITATVAAGNTLAVNIALPNGERISFVGDTIPPRQIDAILNEYPKYASNLLSLDAQWSSLYSQLSTDLTTQSTTVPAEESLGPGESIVPITSAQQTTTYYENDGTASSSISPTISQPPAVTTYYENDGTASTDAQIPTTFFENDGTESSSFYGALDSTRAEATTQDVTGFTSTADWRVRLSLAPGISKAEGYLYLADEPGILAPLQQTNGIVFPYTPQISISYTANYDANEPVHSNYKLFQYKNSGVDNISVTCNFTAQDNTEAAYLLAVIHFLRSVTKMFYGYDSNPKAGTPPPLCYLTGLGQYQFNAHPLVISGFTYTLPEDVDYIRAYTTSFTIPKQAMQDPQQMMSARLAGLPIGGNNPPTKWSTTQNAGQAVNEPTYVPTKMQIAFQAHPIVTRNAVSNFFSLKDYASGKLLKGNQVNSGGYYGGIW